VSRLSIWTLLDLTPTRDQREIRRAYAARLKTLDQEADAEAFKLLRAAYETALRLSQQPTHESAEATPPVTEPAAPQALPDTSPAPRVPDADIEGMRLAFGALHRCLESAEPQDGPSAPEALASLLAAPGWQRLDLARDCESALAHLLADAVPHSDGLLQDCIARFRWQDAHRGIAIEPAVRRVLDRQLELGFRQQLTDGKNPLSAAYQRLQQPPGSILNACWAYWMGASRCGEVGLLTRLRDEFPGMLATLDPENVRWWQSFGQRPQLPYVTTRVLAGLAGILILAAILALLGAGNHSDVPFLQSLTPLDLAAAAIVCLLLPFAQMYLVEWPTVQVARHWQGRLSLGLKVGWFPLLTALLAAVSLVAWMVPASDSLPLNIAVATIGVLCAMWAIYVSGPMPPFDREKGNYLQSSRLLRVLMSNLVPGICLVYFATVASPGAVPAYVVAALALMITVSLGLPNLAQVWEQRFSPPARLVTIAALLAAMVAILVLAPIFYWSGSASLFASAAVTAIVLQRIASSRIVWKNPGNLVLVWALLIAARLPSMGISDGASWAPAMGVALLIFSGYRLVRTFRLEYSHWRTPADTRK